MTGYKIPKGFVEGYRNAIERYPKDSQYAWGMNAVVEALEVYPLEELDENPWHTGRPTEDGEYLVICQYVIDNYYYRKKLVWEFENGDWKDKQRYTESNYVKELKILAWYGQKIEPYEESNG